MLKVLYLPINDLENVQQGMYDAWNEVGVQLEVCDFHRMWLQTRNRTAVNQDFINKASAFQPDLIHMQLQFTGLIDPPSLIEVRKHCPNAVMINWTGDVRAGAQFPFVQIAPYVNYSLISSTGQLDMYKAAGVKNVAYWQIGFDPKISFPLWKTEFEYDISFAANYHGNIFPDAALRVDVAKNLREVFGKRFGFFGSGQGPDITFENPKRMNDIYNSSICTLSINHFNDISHYFSDRLLSCLASGRPVISWYFPKHEEYFKDGVDLFIARSKDDVVRITKYCKNNSDVANSVGKNGYNKAIKEHTFKCRVIELLKMTNLIDRV